MEYNLENFVAESHDLSSGPVKNQEYLITVNAKWRLIIQDVESTKIANEHQVIQIYLKEI